MVSPGKLELDAIARMQEHVRLVRDEVLLKSEVPQVKGILLTLADHYSITRDTWMHIQQAHPNLLFTTLIPRACYALWPGNDKLQAWNEKHIRVM